MSYENSLPTGLVAYEPASDAESEQEEMEDRIRSTNAKQDIIVQKSYSITTIINQPSETSNVVIKSQLASSSTVQLSSIDSSVPPLKKPKLGTGMSLLTYGYDEDEHDSNSDDERNEQMDSSPQSNTINLPSSQVFETQATENHIENLSPSEQPFHLEDNLSNDEDEDTQKVDYDIHDDNDDIEYNNDNVQDNKLSTHSPTAITSSSSSTAGTIQVSTKEMTSIENKKKMIRPGTPPPQPRVKESAEFDREIKSSNGGCLLKSVDPSSLARSVQNLRSKDIVLPPEPSPKHMDEELEKIVSDAVARMKRDSRYDPNKNIQDNKDFRNPSIYEKLISFLDIDEKGSNFPPSIYNPHRWTDTGSYYDELARVQNEEMKKREQRKDGGNKKIDFVSVTKTASGVTRTETNTITSTSETRKKSKWDAPPTAVPTASSSSSKVIIPAVGSLTKKKS